MKRIPISPQYDRAIYEAVVIQILFGLMGLMILDGGGVAQICGIALVAFWGGAAVLIWRHPLSPSRTDIVCIRFGSLPLLFISGFMSGAVWHLRGVL